MRWDGGGWDGWKGMRGDGDYGRGDIRGGVVGCEVGAKGMIFRGQFSFSLPANH